MNRKVYPMNPNSPHVNHKQNFIYITLDKWQFITMIGNMNEFYNVKNA